MKQTFFSKVKERALFIWKIPSFPSLFLINFIFGLSSSFFLPFSSIFGIDEAKMSNIEFGIFMTITALGGVFISSYLARLSDTNTSRKRLLILTSAAGVIGYSLYAFLRNYYALSLTGFFILGASAGTIPQLWAYARDALKSANIPNEEAPLIMNVFRMFFALSWTAGPAIGSVLLMKAGFTGLFLFVAAGYLLALVTIIFLLKDISNQKVSADKPPMVKTYIKRPYISGYLAAAFMLSAATSIHMLNIPQFVTKALHGSELDVGLVFSVPPIFEVPFMVIVGILATKINNAILIRIAFSIAFIYFSMIGFVKEPWQILPLQILSAAQISVTAGIAISFFQDLIPEAPGMATTLYMNTTQIGSTIGYLMFGFISEAISYRSVITVYTVMAGIGVLCQFLLAKEKQEVPNSIPTKAAS